MKKIYYDQKTGVLRHEGRVIAHGYAGRPPYVNSTEAEMLSSRGPLPRGKYGITAPYGHVRLGPVAMFLKPDEQNRMFGRSGFFIHGDNRHVNRTASSGCIVLDRHSRDLIASLLPATLYVV